MYILLGLKYVCCVVLLVVLGPTSNVDLLGEKHFGKLIYSVFICLSCLNIYTTCLNIFQLLTGQPPLFRCFVWCSASCSTCATM